MLEYPGGYPPRPHSAPTASAPSEEHGNNVKADSEEELCQHHYQRERIIRMV